MFCLVSLSGFSLKASGNLNFSVSPFSICTYLGVSAKFILGEIKHTVGDAFFKNLIKS